MQQFDSDLLAIEALEEQLEDSFACDKDKSGCSDEESKTTVQKSSA